MKKKKKKTKSTIPRKHRMEEPVWRSEAPKKNTSRLYNFDKRYYFNLKAHRWKRHIDGTWDNGPIISRVPLSPEQAVLSCCATTVGMFAAVRFNSVGAGTKCWQGAGPVGGHCTSNPGDQKGDICLTNIAPLEDDDSQTSS